MGAWLGDKGCQGHSRQWGELGRVMSPHDLNVTPSSPVARYEDMITPRPPPFTGPPPAIIHLEDMITPRPPTLPRPPTCNKPPALITLLPVQKDMPSDVSVVVGEQMAERRPVEELKDDDLHDSAQVPSVTMGRHIHE